jgi:hypothetical protein
MFAELEKLGVQHETLMLPCGHYSLELPPFSYIAGFRLGTYMRDRLT